MKRLTAHIERIENMISSGMPDVTYCLRGVEGFIELKEISDWPARPETPIHLPHYTPSQRNWHRARLQRGGRVYVLMGIGGKEWQLYHAGWALTRLGKDATRTDCTRAALAKGVGRFPGESIAEVITGPFRPDVVTLSSV